MRSLEQVNIRTNVRTYVRTYVLTYIRTGQTLYPLHNFVVRGDNNKGWMMVLPIWAMDTFCWSSGASPEYRISLVIRRISFLPKQSQRSRSVLKDGSRSLALFRNGKIGIIAKFHRTGLVI